jgi:hypothetical protein
LALNASQGVLSIASTDTSKTITLASNFDPKAIILWGTRQATDLDNSTNGEMYIGVATYDGAVVQQYYSAAWLATALASSDDARGRNTTACLKGYSAVTPTVDFELRLTSMSTGATSNVIINVFDAPAATMIVHYLVLGGTDIVKARVGSSTNGAASPQAITISAGWGQPDLLFFLGTGATGAATGDSNGNTWVGLGVAKSDTVRQASVMGDSDNSATITSGSWQKQRALLQMVGVAADAEADLDIRANWPTDGFQLTWPDLAANAANAFGYLALQGTFQSTIGVQTAQITGVPTVDQDTTIGFTPKAAIVFHRNLAAATTIDSTSTDLGYWGIGGTDGTTQGHVGVSLDDLATDSTSYRTMSQTKGLRFFKPTGTIAQAPTKMSEAALSFSGSNLRASWSTIDSVAREWCYVVFGDAVAAASFVRPLLSVSGQAMMRGSFT